MAELRYDSVYKVEKSDPFGLIGRFPFIVTLLHSTPEDKSTVHPS